MPGRTGHRENRNQWFVYFLKADGQQEIRPVRMGEGEMLRTFHVSFSEFDLTKGIFINSESQNGENLKPNERKRLKRCFCFVAENRDPNFTTLSNYFTKRGHFKRVLPKSMLSDELK